MKRTFAILLTLIAALLAAKTQAQIIVRCDSTARFDADSLRRAYDSGPSFSFYKDNYFIFGMPIGPKPTAANSNVKFQISFQQKLTRSTLPLNTYLYLMYSQKCFWNVLENSMPMTDLVFNPGIGIARPFFSTRTGQYIGKVFMLIEHESNGKGAEASRSWNRVTFGGSVFIDKNIMVSAKVWIPIIDGVHNQDILNYYGIYQTGVQFMSDNRRFGAALVITKRKDWNPFHNNIELNLKWKFSETSNVYLFMQYYNGYAEDLLNYKQRQSMLRLGICMSPMFFSEF